MPFGIKMVTIPLNFRHVLTLYFPAAVYGDKIMEESVPYASCSFKGFSLVIETNLHQQLDGFLTSHDLAEEGNLE